MTISKFFEKPLDKIIKILYNLDTNKEREVKKMKITKSEVIRTEIDNVPDEDAINRVTNMLNDICRSLGELSDYDLINGYNVVSNKDIWTALMVIDTLLMGNDEWTVKRKE